MMILTKSIFFMIVVSECFGQDYEINNKTFPDNFWFGTATASYQVEGGWNEDAKTPSIWDNITHNRPDYIVDLSNGDVACDSYHKFKEDVAILKDLGVNYYRLSIAWTRILPNGIADVVNIAGINYYRNLLQELKANNIEPLVTLYHWDLPQVLQDQGGFINESIIEWFTDYARVCFKAFGDEVKYWITFNEPKQICYGGYGAGYKAPAINSEGVLDYQCAHNLLKAHAAAWHLYNDEFRVAQAGKLSIVTDSSWYEPASDSEEDKVAAETIIQFELGWFANPIYVGDYPEIMKTRIASRSRLERYNQSRLPEFTQEQIDYINGTHDFYALNHYTTSMANAIPEPVISSKPSRYGDEGVDTSIPPGALDTSAGWLQIVPWGLRKLLKFIKERYGNPNIIITENGVCDGNGTLEDDDRIYYLQNYISNVRDAMDKDDVKVFGYTVWSLMDNFEWTDGYTVYHIIERNHIDHLLNNAMLGKLGELRESHCAISRNFDMFCECRFLSFRISESQ